MHFKTIIFRSILYVFTNVQINCDRLRATISLGTWCLKLTVQFCLLFVSPTFLPVSFAYSSSCLYYLPTFIFIELSLLILQQHIIFNSLTYSHICFVQIVSCFFFIGLPPCLFHFPTFMSDSLNNHIGSIDLLSCLFH